MAALWMLHTVPLLLHLTMIWAVSSDSVKQIPQIRHLGSGEEAIFYCIFPFVQASSRIQVGWWKDVEGSYLKASGDQRYSFEIRNKISGTFRLRDVRVSDSGRYYCSALYENKVQNGTGTELLVTAAEFSSSGVYQFPINMNVGGGENAIMYCKFPISQGTVDVHWWRGGMKTFLEPDSRKQFTIDSGSGTFTLQHVRVADSGLYYCQVKFQQQVIGNGSGCQVTVFAPPTPLKIVVIEGSAPHLPQLVCKTAAFYPEKLEVTWQRNNVEILTGIETVINRTADGFYEASSFLQDTQPAADKTVYTCLVSHASLTVPASYSCIVEQDPETIDKSLILGCVVGGLSIVILTLFFIRFGLKAQQESTYKRLILTRAVGGLVILLLIIIVTRFAWTAQHGMNTCSMDPSLNRGPDRSFCYKD